MEINKKIAKGIKVVGEDYEYIKAVSKSPQIKITQEVWFKGKAKHFKTKLKGGLKK